MEPRIITAEQLKALLTSPSGRPQLLDVRQPAEYQQGHLPGATLLPLPELGERATELDPSKPVVAYCHSGRRSLAAAGLLLGQGFADVASLAGGMSGWEGQAATGDEAQGLGFFPAGAKPLEVLALAWAMEDNLGRFYAGLAAKAPDPRLKELFGRLHRFEESHKAMVLHLARLLDPTLADQQALAVRAPAAVSALEGGLSPEEFLERNADELRSLQLEALKFQFFHGTGLAAERKGRAAQAPEYAPGADQPLLEAPLVDQQAERQEEEGEGQGGRQLRNTKSRGS